MYPSARPNQIHLQKAVIYSLFSSLMCAGMLALAKNSLNSASVNQITFFRNLVAFFLLIPCIIVAKKGQSFREFLKTPFFGIHLIRTIVGLIIVSLFLTSLRTISISEANILYNTTPLFIPLVLYVWKGTKMHYKGWSGISIAFLGVILLMRPQTGSYAIGLFLALLSGVGGAISIVVQRQIYNQEPFYRGLFYYIFLSIPMTGVFLLFEPLSPLLTSDMQTQGFLLGMAVSAFFTQIFLSLSIKYAPARFIAPFAYISLIFSLLLDIYVWGKTPALLELCGMGLIIAGLCIFLLLQAKQSQDSAYAE